MANAWVGNGPVSLPPRSLAYVAAGLIMAAAAGGLAMGFRAAMRSPAEPGSASAAASTADGEITAHPIVEMPPPVTAPTQEASDATIDAKVDAELASESIASKAAAAQAVQSKPSSPTGNIDDILTSPQEKPPAPVKAQPEEAPPQAPIKSDVPF